MFTNGKEIKVLRAYGKLIQGVYYGTKVVWQAIRSCFGAGYWINDKAWINEENWKD
jgi:hypothetical protein